MRIAIAGMTGHVNYVLDALNADPTLSVAAVSPGAPGENIAPLLATLDRMGQWPQVVESAEELVGIPGIDIAVAAAPFYRNAEIAIAALRRSLAVFCEKPVALTLDGLRDLQREQEAAGRPICAMFGLRNEPHFAAAKRCMEEDAVGDPILISAQKSYKMGQRPPFFSERELYGGTIPWVAIHALDWCVWLTGKKYVDVSARHTALSNGGNGTMESAGAMMLSLEGGAMATIHADFLRPDGAYTHGDDRVRVAGEHGVLEVRAGHTYYTPSHGLQLDIDLSPVPNVFEAFARSLQGLCEPPVSTQESLYATAAALIAREAADSGRTLRFDAYGW